MNSILKVFVYLLFFYFVVCSEKILTQADIEGIEFLPMFMPKNISGEFYCATEDIYRWKQAVSKGLLKDGAFSADESSKLACQPEGSCDNPIYRNAYDKRELEVGLNIFILCASAGNCNGITVERVTAMLETLAKDYAVMQIKFYVNEIKFVVDSRYATISAYTPLNSQWYTDIVNVKNLYAEDPTKFCNVFATAQTASIYGTLLGIGTFPWDPASGTKTGGLWLNAVTVRGADFTFAHEVGHNVGLWHTFHGDSEVTRCGDCYEFVHQETDDVSWPNTVGDFCADTPAQPNNQNCANPTSADCEGTRWDKFGQNLINNIMAYTINANGRVGCNNVFTNQQRTRSHCWICNSPYVRGWVPAAACALKDN